MAELRSVIVLDRIEPGELPDYCIHGRATCCGCSDWVWLGDQTAEVVASGRADPLCRQCASRLVPRTEKPVEHIDDRRRDLGTH